MAASVFNTKWKTQQTVMLAEKLLPAQLEVIY